MTALSMHGPSSELGTSFIFAIDVFFFVASNIASSLHGWLEGWWNDMQWHLIHGVSTWVTLFLRQTIIFIALHSANAGGHARSDRLSSFGDVQKHENNYKPSQQHGRDHVIDQGTMT